MPSIRSPKSSLTAGKIVARAGLALTGLVGGAVALASMAPMPSSSPGPLRPLPDGPLTPRAAPLIIGVGVHFGIGGEYGYDPARTAQAIDTVGASSFRDDLTWPGFKGAGMNAPGSMRPRLAAFLAATKARPLFILDHPNPAIGGDGVPVTDAGRAAFANFAGEAARQTAGRRPIYEIWNEWNLNAAPAMGKLIGRAAPGDPRGGDAYARLAAKATAAIRASQPNATVLAGAAGTDDGWQWVHAVAGGGGLKGADGLSVHYYNHCERPDNRTAAEAITRMQALATKMRIRGGRAMPIYVTEIGWPTTQGGPCDIARNDSGNNIAQFLLWSAATPWMRGVWIYQLKDQAQDPTDNEANFGLFTYDYKPKPAACMMRDVSRLIGRAKSWRIDRPQPGLTVARMNDGQSRTLIAWTDRAAQKAELQIGGAPTPYRPICSPAGPRDTTIPVGSRPVVVSLSGSGAGIRYRML
ncbi:glycosyl hydrolase family 17 [Sphingomonas sp. PP-CE-3A-406]|uniref:cellulase family glycosylhydrolase n=1 Tax=Sphingomonas sp. PP-CE-3A-406 TaxID=2135659 RepID=UPI000EFA00AA|nr:cellulase family glycosylhydrolase [Sphingomonas sp. PP-CE-3A-406]RMB51807.1 glycosyl hydrolase family 17 [Sphingomonas sp. PP-CE-3A-406]